MPVKTDNINHQRREELRAQGRARQARHAARKRAERAALLTPSTADVDEALVRALLATGKTLVIFDVLRSATDALRANGYSGVKGAMRERTSALRPAPKVVVPSPAPKSNAAVATPSDTPVTPTHANSDTPDRIADLQPA